jgi:hypothetical protein
MHVVGTPAEVTDVLRRAIAQGAHRLSVNFADVHRPEGTWLFAATVRRTRSVRGGAAAAPRAEPAVPTLTPEWLSDTRRAVSRIEVESPARGRQRELLFMGSSVVPTHPNAWQGMRENGHHLFSI